ncbi:DNA mismatch repair protein MutL [Pleurotus eryngii]|uniref:DNA mismatch repair protein PMS1 n=1 Tax=Pleurotus eryngii TaxID=5323 RepID=A0A9P6A440_PLEER|nr:DNA mismatch repair protein MutL [Pleurotus eryngii]
MSGATIKAIDSSSIHRITSGQVVIDLQTAVKELVENSIDAGATSIDIRFKHYGLRAIEVVDNGCGINEEDHESIALKHCTSKLSSFSDLTTVHTFGFRGEALSSLCALSESVTVTTSTKAPMGTSLDMAPSGKVKRKSKVARQRGTTINIVNIFLPLPVRRKEFERNLKREYGKAITLLTAYALVPCTSIRLSVTNQLDSGNKSVQLRTNAASSVRAAVTALWGNKALDDVVDLDLTFDVERDKRATKRLAALQPDQDNTDMASAASLSVFVKGLISKFSVNQGRSGTDRQFFYINGRPCNLSKVQKAFNEVYRSFNATQSPFIIADFLIPTDSYDVNVSPDKRTIFLHNEANLIAALRKALEKTFSPSRSTYDMNNNLAALVSQRIAITPSPTKKRTRATPDERPGSSKRTTPESEDEGGDNKDGEPESNVGEETMMPNDKLATPEPPTPSRTRARHCQQALSSPPSSPSASLPPINVLEDDPEPTAVVLDTTKAIWSQGAPRSPRQPTPSEGGDDDCDKEDAVKALNAVDEEVQEPPRKKQRRTVSASPALVQRKIKDMFRQPADVSNSASLVLATRNDVVKTNTANGGGAQGVAQRDVVARSLTLVNRRSHLRDYMMPGSQGLADSSSGNVDLNEGVDDEAADEEQAAVVDELMSPSPRSDVTDTADAMDLDALGAEEITSHRDPLFLDSPKPDFVDFTDDPLFEDDISTLDEPDSSILTPSQTSSAPILRPEVIRSNSTNESGDVTVRFDFTRISQVWLDFQDRLLDASVKSPGAASNGQDVEMGDAGVTNVSDEDKAIQTLTRVIEKQDFVKMQIVGQFNLGFIIVRRRKSRSQQAGVDVDTNLDADSSNTLDDLFIVDQHAADEKYNFEQLQETTKIKSQRLFKPLNLELTAADEIVALENIEVLRNNGFDVVTTQDVEENASDSSSCPTRRRLQLIAQPVSKDTIFGVKDLEELIQLMHDHPAGQMVRPSKTRAMFAMRACRKSVMVGMPLTKRQMTTVVHHMGTMDLPWNCPHGRPTMRHLSDISSTQEHLKAPTFRPIDWSRLERM